MTYVHITIDTEFSSCGYFNAPPTGEPVGEQAVRCVVNGQSHGLDFLLSTFAAHGVRATFFVEALNTLYFGDEPMGRIARAIHAAGHDLQLHLHPSWLACAAPNAPERPLRPVTDHCGELDDATAGAAIALALDVFARWGVPRPIAFRAGNLQAGLGLYRALAANRFALASSLAMGIYRPAEPELQIHNGRRRVEGVLETPVTTYAVAWAAGRHRLKALSITGATFAEMRIVLAQAQAAGLEDVVVLTHPFEFVKRGDHQYRRLTRNRVNQRRLIALCALLADQASGLRSATFRDRAEAWLAGGNRPDVLLRVPLGAAAIRMGENFLNDRLWAY